MVTYRISKYVQHLLSGICILKKLSVEKKKSLWLCNFIRCKYAVRTSDSGLFSSLVSPLAAKVLQERCQAPAKKLACAITIFSWLVTGGPTTLLRPRFKYLCICCNCTTCISSVTVFKQQCKKYNSTSYQHRTPLAYLYLWHTTSYNSDPFKTVLQSAPASDVMPRYQGSLALCRRRFSLFEATILSF